MEATPSTASFFCPGCQAELDAPSEPGRTQCPLCAWQGEVYVFNARPRQVEAPELALPEDARCTHHPDKRAEVICAGTGDYICSLCRVDLGEQSYSADYVNRVGRDKLNQHFQRFIARPDRVAIGLILLAVLPFMWFVSPLLLIVAAVMYVRAYRLRRTDPVFRQVVGRAHLVGIPLVLGLVATPLVILGLVILVNAF